jgi:hypothetical protein
MLRGAQAARAAGAALMATPAGRIAAPVRE